MILTAAAALATIWLVSATVRGVRRRRSRSAVKAEPRIPRRWAPVLAGSVTSLTAIVTLASVGLIVALPGLVDSGFLGWLEVPLAFRLALHLPLALAVLSVAAVGVAFAGWSRRWWPREICLQHAAPAIAAAALAAQLASWGLIGWGFS